MLLKTRVHVSNPRGGGGGGWARADPAQKGEGEPRSRMPPVAAGPPAALGSGSPSARALGTAQLTPLPSSAPRSSGGPGRTTCSSGTGRRSPRQQLLEDVRAALQVGHCRSGSPCPRVHPVPSTGAVVSELRDTQGDEVSVMELTRAVGKTTSRDTRGGEGGRVTTPAT